MMYQLRDRTHPHIPRPHPVERAAAFLGLVAAAPVALAVAAISAVSLRTPRVFFAQMRVGYEGRPLRMVKFRTLPLSAPTSATKYDLLSQRVPAPCRLLRRLHVDELPQLWLVLRGDMRLVGPRPEQLDQAAAFPAEFAAIRQSVLPGVTGLWQVSVAANGLICEAPEYDAFYVRHRCPRLDAAIVLRTLAVAVSDRARVDLHWASEHAGLGAAAATDAVDLTATAEPVIDLRDGHHSSPQAYARREAS